MENLKNINIDEIPFLDCREKENNKILIKMFNDIKPIKRKGMNYKENFKGNIDNLEKIVDIILEKRKLEISTISYFSKRQYCQIIKAKTKKEKKILTTIVSKSLNELFLKICVYCYYKNER